MSRKKVGTLIPLPQLQAGDYLIEQREWSSVLLYHFGGRPIVAPERAPAYVTVKANGYWTVVQHRSGWTKIASADGQHAGWTFYVRDYFERV